MKKTDNGLSRRELLKSTVYTGLGAGLSSNLWLNGCVKKNRELPNIILITLDTTRADHLSCYGYRRQTSPNLDKLAEESILYTRAVAPSNWTLPSHASLFTGKFTSSHGMKYDPLGQLYLADAITCPETWPSLRVRGMASNETTLAQIMRETGYSTGAVVAGPWMKKVFGLNKGFEYYDDTEISSINGRSARLVTASALKWVEKMSGNPFFLFLNYFDPHAPYLDPEDFDGAFPPEGADWGRKGWQLKEEKDYYDAEILYMDHYVGKLVKKLKALNLYKNSMIIVTADHGELLGEHGEYGHGYYLYQEEIHIPLFIKYPSLEVSPNRTDVPVQLNDIMAIILDRLEIDAPKGVQSGVPPNIGHPMIAETYPLPVISQHGNWRAIFNENIKLIWNSKDRHLLFNMTDDPGEKLNIASMEPDRFQHLMSDLNKYLTTLPMPGPASAPQDLDQDTKEALMSLGYVK